MLTVTSPTSSEKVLFHSKEVDVNFGIFSEELPNRYFQSKVIIYPGEIVAMLSIVKVYLYLYLYTYVSFSFLLSCLLSLQLVQKMASSVENHRIDNIEMDHFGSSTGCLATQGVGPCICFVVTLNNGQQIFLEHRSDIFFHLN